MYISSLELENFRCYGGPETHRFEFGSGLNFFVGNNNVGKTTLFHAVDFVLNAKTAEGYVTKGYEDEGVRVTLVLSDVNLDRMRANAALARVVDYVGDDRRLVLRRSSKHDAVLKKQGRALQESRTDVSNLQVYSPRERRFEVFSASGLAKNLFVPIVMFSDTDNGDFQDMGKTKTLGQLLADVVVGRLKSSKEWKAYLEAHQALFGPDGIDKYAEGIKSRVNEYLTRQYGSGSIDFEFDPLDADAFIKNGTLLAEDHGVETDVAAKGTGMQRSIALALMRVSADQSHSDDGDCPFVYFLDEPETFMHPQAQDLLLDDLDAIAEESQVFVTTHSPYLLRSYSPVRHRLLAFARDDDGEIEVDDGSGESLGFFSKGRSLGPSWGAINYFAFGVASVDFHIELFDRVTRIVQEALGWGPEKVPGPTKVDHWLMRPDVRRLTPGSQVPLTGKNHVNCNPHCDRGAELKHDMTMPVYIRNYIDHPGPDPSLPEGMSRDAPDRADLARSIEYMLALIRAKAE